MSNMPPAPPEQVQPPLIVTMGDPAGIGPEIVLQALQRRPELRKRLVVVGDLATLRRAAGWVGLDPAFLSPIAGGSLAQALASALPLAVAVVPCGDMPTPAPLGQVSALAGQAAAECIAWGAHAVLSGQAAALVTAPIHKESLAAAGVSHPGHTEMLQALAAEFQGLRVADLPVRMMLSAPGLHTVLVSIHVSLRDAIEAVTIERVLDTIRITARHFERCGLLQTRIAVAGLNPHAGEGGLFGREEIETIAPAVALARSEGIEASGPHAPDTVFMRARQGAFDVVVAMYHDQGLIPVKLLGLEHGVNTTLGLPLVRTSPDHGTAFDLAGTGRASEASLLAAIDAAMQMVDRKFSPKP